MNRTDQKYMQRALELAAKGGRAVAPNPMVGAVIVKNGVVIGEGYHKVYGGPHAEVRAIQAVAKKSELDGATLYVTLEPCFTYGKTPPCLDFVEAMGIERIVCGSKDAYQRSMTSDPMTSDQSGVEFIGGYLEKECVALNKFFFTWASKKRPFITVKIAMTADGFVAGPNGEQLRITTAEQNAEVHQLRADHQAILVGMNTVKNDNPRLTVRHVKGLNPLKVVIGSKEKMPKDARLLKDGNHLIVHSSKDEKVDLKKLFARLAQDGVSSVLVEPGPTLYASLKKAKFIDELIVFRSEKKVGSGLELVL